MGLNAGLYVIPADKFAKEQAKGTFELDECEPWFDLDKAWSEFNEVLKKRPGPLAYAIEGDVRPNPDQLGFNFVSPEVVAQIALALESKDVADEIVDEIIRQGTGLGWTESDERGYYAGYFEELRKAYQTAAARGAALGILIC